MSTTTERPRSGIKVPPGLLVPEIENDLTRREFLIGTGSLLAPGASGETRTIEHAPEMTEA